MEGSAKKQLYASEKNKQPILGVLDTYLQSISNRKGEDEVRILEIASGTGEHANYFLTNSVVDRLVYQPTEPETEMHSSIEAWCAEVQGKNHRIHHPIALAMNIDSPFDDTILPEEYRNRNSDCIICINMIHISDISNTEALFEMASKVVSENGIVYLYGPYRVQGTMVESNVKFDESLKSRNPTWGIRDLEYVESKAALHGFRLKDTVSMPANNLSVIFCRAL